MNYKDILRELFWNYRKIVNRDLIKKSSIFWEKNKNKYKGRRGFIIGNGPSLRISDLDLLLDEITISSNKIYLAFKETNWRSTYLTIGDRLLWKEINKEIYKYHSPVIVSHDRIPIINDDTILYKNNGYYKFDNYGFSQDVINGLWGGRTITYNNIQIAVHLGLNPIYLIGCDHYYSEDKPDSDDNKVITHSDLSNHFIHNYRKAGQKINYAPIDIMTSAYENAKLVCEKNNISIINATRGGYLEVFDRIDIDCLF